MLTAAEASFANADIALFAAAVADMRPANPADKKLKKGKNDSELSAIQLAETPISWQRLATRRKTEL